jgi:formate dehydrogenase assembly factor FdhD
MRSVAANRRDRMGDAAASERRVPVRKFSGGDVVEAEDRVAVEEPLEIIIGWPAETEGSIAETRNIAVTMRTPGNDAELALGFLFTEGLIPSVDAVVDVRAEPKLNRVTVILREVAESSAAALERNFYMTSSCGVCGQQPVRSCGSRRSRWSACRSGWRNIRRYFAARAAFMPQHCSMRRVCGPRYLRTSAGIMPSTSWWARCCEPGSCRCIEPAYS